MGHLAGGRRRREPQTTTRPMPALIRPAQSPNATTLTRPCRSTGPLFFASSAGLAARPLVVAVPDPREVPDRRPPEADAEHGASRGEVIERGPLLRHPPRPATG